MDLARLAQAHVIENNAFNISGVAVLCTCTTAVVRGNTISCPGNALRLSCRDCSVLDNAIAAATAPTAQPVALGQIDIAALAQFKGQTTCRIIGNRLKNGPGHGIRMATDILDVTVAMNHIEACAGSAIFTETGASVDRIDVAGNHITACGFSANKPVATGTIILFPITGDGAVHSNRLINNAGGGIYASPIVARQAQGPTLRIQDNLVTGQTGNQSQVLVFVLGSAVQFTGNQGLHVGGAQPGLAFAMIMGQWVVANANTLLGDREDAGASLISLAFPAGPTTSGIFTSNIVNGIFTFGFSHLQNANNINV